MQMGILRGIHHCTTARGDVFRVGPKPTRDSCCFARSSRPLCAYRERDSGRRDADFAHSTGDCRLRLVRLGLGSQGFGDRTQPDFAQRPLTPRRRGQQRREHRVHRQHHTHLGHEPP